MATTHNLMGPVNAFHERGKIICERNTSANGWMCYGAARLIQWDDRQGEFAQNGHTAHYSMTSGWGTTPQEVSSARMYTLRHFSIPFSFSGWARIDKEPSGHWDGIKIGFLHEDNMSNWLWQLMRKSRTSNIYQEDRNGHHLNSVGNPENGKAWVGGNLNWLVKRQLRWKIDVSETGLISCYADDMRNPYFQHQADKIATTGQVGFRLDNTNAHVGGLVVREY